MKTECTSACCDPRAAAVALGRWCIGLMFLVAGLTKLTGQNGVWGFAQFLSQQFEKTWLPTFLISAFGYVLPFAEVASGVLLLLGIYRNAALFGTALLMLSLTFGMIILQQAPVVFYNTGYTILISALLFLSDYDRWVLFPRRPRSSPLDAL